MPSPSLTDGVPGLEGIHTLTPPSPWPSVVLNAWEDPTTGLTQLPHTRLRDIQGLLDKADSDDPRMNLVNRMGETAFPRQQRGKTLVYTGVVVGATLSEMRALIAKLRAATETLSSSPDGWGAGLSAAYNPTYDPTGMVFSAYGMPIAFTCDETQGTGDQSPTPYQRDFVLSYRMADPRWWVTSPGPIVVGSPTPIADGVSAVLTMTGTAPTEPTFNILGSGSGSSTIQLYHTELNRTLEIDLPAALTSGEVMIVDFFNRTITAGGNDVTGYIDWASTDWWGEAASGAPMLVGANTLTVSGGSWSCAASPACW